MILKLSENGVRSLILLALPINSFFAIRTSQFAHSMLPPAAEGRLNPDIELAITSCCKINYKSLQAIRFHFWRLPLDYRPGAPVDSALLREQCRRKITTLLSLVS